MRLRLEGVDAPELHYGTAAQPLGREARDQLLAWLGFTELEYAPPGARERPRGRLRRYRAAPERAADSGQQLGPLAGRPLDVVFVER